MENSEFIADAKRTIQRILDDKTLPEFSPPKIKAVFAAFDLMLLERYQELESRMEKIQNKMLEGF